MLFRMLLVFAVIAISTAGFLHLALYTNYFNKQRLTLLRRNALIVAAGFVMATIAIALLVALTN